MSTEVALIEIKNPLQIFSTPKGLDAIIDKIEVEAKSIDRDISTEAGRDNIRSLAFKLAKTKTFLDKTGKDLTEDARLQIAAVNAERSRVWDRMEKLQAEIRQPLTDWEQAEKKRVDAHEAGILTIQQHIIFAAPPSPDDIERSIASLIDFGKSRNWEEFAMRAEYEHKTAHTWLISKIAEVKKNEADAIELARLRAEEDARKQKEHDDQIAAAAAAKAKSDAEAIAAQAAAKASAEAKAAEDKAASEAAAAAAREEKERQEKIAAQQRAEKAESDAKAAADKAALDAVLAAALAETEKKKAAEAAAQAERDKAAALKAAEEKAAAARAADTAHKAKINNEALAALADVISECDEGDDKLKTIIIAIAKGVIPHVSIKY